MDRFVFLLTTGIADGVVFALFALSLVLIWRSTRIINFAAAAMAVAACYLALAVTDLTGSYWAGLIVAVLVGGTLGWAVERGIMRAARDPLSGVILAIGTVMVLQALTGILAGPQSRPTPVPFGDRPVIVGGVATLSPYDLFVIAVAVTLTAGLHTLFARTSLGLQMRAAAFAPEMSRLLGVPVARMRTIGWILAAAVGALAVLLAVPGELGLDPHAGDSLFVSAFAVAVIGGLDSAQGAVIGGLLVGVLISLVTGYLGAAVAPLGVLALLALVLLVRPAGLFAGVEARRV
ncbi:branched-chain amino acid ABC transporter permease [Kineosporia sp. NBRC 101731]|uniref:branched-chain amino acid ABC transporter permease n=1 Tax=Kineosporia sp. NBRC 101731 TaxID=3032199 RepID=UPI0024A18EE5|nr:branched-chain amino acid ABC transporter permease [Kineosporia sp. NBRC 101731]GLY32239.1 branched-chain amino acid ABC transporter permease [Kineosporia sp. NBRC 101731]